VQREVETKIARALIAGDIGEDTTIVVDVEDDELSVRWPGGVEEGRPQREAVGV
jgi:ATP-dependent Clp protease ATP-binding subunit ClpB